MIEGASFSAEDICDHPDRKDIRKTTDEDRLKIALRENIFTNRDPICVNCMKCICPKSDADEIPCENCDYEKSCLISEKEMCTYKKICQVGIVSEEQGCLLKMMMSSEDSKKISKHDLYNPKKDMCSVCYIKSKCEGQ